MILHSRKYLASKAISQDALLGKIMYVYINSLVFRQEFSSLTGFNPD